MTQSTKLLLRLIRVRLAVGMSVAFALFLLIALFQPPLDKEYGPLLSFVGFGLALLMGLHSLLGYTMFPVTDRQVAWIPMAAWGLVSLAGAAGLIVGQVFIAFARGKIPFYDIMLYWLPVVRVFSARLFLLLILWRMVRLRPGFVGFFGLLPALVLPSGKGGIIAPWVAELYLAGWPLWALGCVFLIWEAPRQTAVLRRLDYQEGGEGFGSLKVRTAQLNGPARPSWPTRLADGLTGLVLFVVFALIFSQSVFAPAEQIRRNPYQLFFLFFLFVPISLLVQGWRANRASGLGPWRALAVLLVELTGVGYPFRDWLGVARGAHVRCPFCGGWRMAWQAECPACGDPRPGAENLPRQYRPGIKSLLLPLHDPGALMFRAWIPVYLLFFIIAFYWSRWLRR